MEKALFVLGLLVMAYNLFQALGLRREAPGGVIGARMGQLLFFIGFFLLAYLGVVLLAWGMAGSLVLLLLSLVLFLGAVFVLLVLRLIQAIVRAL